jgi:hypothetical protein
VEFEGGAEGECLGGEREGEGEGGRGRGREGDRPRERGGELKGSALAAASSAFLRYTSRELVLLCITKNMTSISTHMEGGSRREEGREEERRRYVIRSTQAASTCAYRMCKSVVCVHE